MVNIVVVCWNAEDYTINTLNSLEKTIQNEKTTYVTVINNGSTDNTEQVLNEFKERTKLNINVITNNTNIGIGAAYNQGLEESKLLKSDYTVFCNNDLQFTNGWLHKMVEIMDSDSSIALLGPLVPSSTNFYTENKTIKEVLLKIENSDSIDSELHNFLGEYKNLDEFQKSITKVNNNIYGSKLRYIMFPNAISSCVIMARTSVFVQIGYFANPFFKEYGGEDIDICWEILDRGYNIAVTNEVYVHHFRGKSIKVAHMDRAKMLKKSNLGLYNLWKGKIINYYKTIGIKHAEQIPNTPENWLINEIKNDIDLNKEFNNGI